MSFFSGAKRKKVDDDDEESKKQTCSGMRATCAFIAWYNCSSWCSPRGMRMVCMRLSTVGVLFCFFVFGVGVRERRSRPTESTRQGNARSSFSPGNGFAFIPALFPVLLYSLAL